MITGFRILFAWPGVTGFTGPCWRALQRDFAMRVKCVAAVDDPAESSCAYAMGSCVAGIDIKIVPKGIPIGEADWDALRDEIRAFAPDILFITGWSVPVNRFLATDAAFQAIPKVFQMDMLWTFRPRKIAARFILKRYLRHFDAAFVPGACAARYARWLGFGGKRPLYTGLLATDDAFFDDAATTSDSPSFLYVGRYSPEKGVDLLMEAYRLYAESVEAPWPLDCAGAGPLADALFPRDEVAVGKGRVRDLGFQQPAALPPLYAAHAAFILPSRSESWGVALAEAAARGLPLICTDACGGRAELVRTSGPDANGFVARAGSIRSLAEAMIRMHNLTPKGRRCFAAASRRLAAPYSASLWAARVSRIVREVTERGTR